MALTLSQVFSLAQPLCCCHCRCAAVCQTIWQDFNGTGCWCDHKQTCITNSHTTHAFSFLIHLPPFNDRIQPFAVGFNIDFFFLAWNDCKWNVNCTKLCLGWISIAISPLPQLASTQAHSQDFYWSYPLLFCDIIIYACRTSTADYGVL